MNAILLFFDLVMLLKIIPDPVGNAHPKITPFLNDMSFGNFKSLFSETIEKLLKVVTLPLLIFFNLSKYVGFLDCMLKLPDPPFLPF